MARSRRTADVVKLDDVILSLGTPPFGDGKDSAMIGFSKNSSLIGSLAVKPGKTINGTPKRHLASIEKIDARISPSRRTDSRNSPSPSPTRDTDTISSRRYNPRLNKIDETPSTTSATFSANKSDPPTPATGASRSDPGPGPNNAAAKSNPPAVEITADLERRLKQKDAQINHLIDKLDSRDEQIEELRAKIDKIQSLLLIVEVRKKFGSDLCVKI